MNVMYIKKELQQLYLILGELVDYKPTLRTLIPDKLSNRQLDVLNIIVNVCTPVTDEDGTRFYHISTKTLEDMGVHNRTFKEVMNISKLFVCTDENYSIKLGIAKKYQPTDRFIELMLLHKSGVSVPIAMLYNIKSSKVEKYKYSHLDKLYKQVVCDWRTEIDLDVKSIDKYIDSLSKEEYDIKHIQLKKLRNLVAANNGKVYCFYRRCKTNRLTGYGTSNLQVIAKEAKKIMFHSYYDFDLVNCTYTILYQMYEKRIGEESTALREYAFYTSNIRKGVALDCGVTPKAVKEAMLLIAFGCSLTNTDHNTPLIRVLGKDGRKNFLQHDFVKLVLKELKDLTDAYRVEINNIIDPSKKYMGVRQRLSWLTQQIEAAIMDVVIEHTDPAVLMYDGMICKEDVDLDELAAKIEEATGYQVEFSRDVFEDNDRTIYEKYIGTEELDGE